MPLFNLCSCTWLLIFGVSKLKHDATEEKNSVSLLVSMEKCLSLHIDCCGTKHSNESLAVERGSSAAAAKGQRDSAYKCI